LFQDNYHIYSHAKKYSVGKLVSANHAALPGHMITLSYMMSHHT